MSMAGKPTGDDRKLIKELDLTFKEEHARLVMEGSSASSPLGDLGDAHTRRLLINLIATMNAAYPDYDFR
jgi:hypothetical protein